MSALAAHTAVPTTTEEHSALVSQPEASHSHRTLRPERLRQAARFQMIHKTGRWWSHRFMALGVLANGLDSSRCGFAVGKRLGTAVVRNRARRRLREAVRLQWADVVPGWDLVFAAREPLRDAGYEEICQAVRTLLRRAHLVPLDP